MWLINTSTFLLEDRRKINGEPYAILSHRWQDGEVSYQDMKEPHEKRISFHGWAKLSAFCVLARQKGYKYAWADTCCINKDSMTELSEAINSMYQWYADAAICIAFLHDVGIENRTLSEAEWFQRGWTLQELIAAKQIEFYDWNWNCLGGKAGLLKELSSRTGIPEMVLSDAEKVRECSVAQRMSWAAERETERVEDRAWSLLGLFGIRTMQPAYGGGEDAFLALQEEIVRKHADHSIFAWTMDPETKYCGPFATSPSAFKTCSNTRCQPCVEPFQVDNLGLSLNLPSMPYSMNTYLCTLRAHQNGEWCAILLTKVPGTEQYVRSRNSKQESRFSVPNQQNFTYRHLRIAMRAPDTIPITSYGFWLRDLSPPGHAVSTIKSLSRDGRDNLDRVSLPENCHGTAGVLSIARADGKPTSRWSRLRWIILGFNDEFQPTCLIANHAYTQSPRRSDFDKALVLDADAKLRDEILSHRWLEGGGGNVPSIVAAWPKGYYRYTFRGNGETLQFDDINLILSINLLPDQQMNPDSQLEHASHKTWVVDVKTCGDSSPEAQHCFSDAQYVCSWAVGALLALVWPCMLNQVHGERIATHGYHSCCAF